MDQQQELKLSRKKKIVNTNVNIGQPSTLSKDDTAQELNLSKKKRNTQIMSRLGGREYDPLTIEKVKKSLDSLAIGQHKILTFQEQKLLEEQQKPVPIDRSKAPEIKEQKLLEQQNPVPIDRSKAPEIKEIRRIQDIGGVIFDHSKITSQNKQGKNTSKFRDFNWLHGYKQIFIAKVDNDSSRYNSYFLESSKKTDKSGANWYLPSLQWWTDMDNSIYQDQEKDIYSFVDKNKNEYKFKVRYQMSNGSFKDQDEKLFVIRQTYFLLKYGTRQTITEYYANQPITTQNTYNNSLMIKVQSRLGNAIKNLDTKFGIQIRDSERIVQSIITRNRNINSTIFEFVKDFFNLLIFLDPKMEFGGFAHIFQKRFIEGYYDPVDLIDFSLYEKIPELVYSLNNDQLQIFVKEYEMYLDSLSSYFIYYIHLELDTSKKVMKFVLPAFKSSLMDKIKPYNSFCKDKENIPLEHVIIYVENGKQYCFSIKDIINLKQNPETNVPFTENFLIDLSHFHLDHKAVLYDSKAKSVSIENEFMQEKHTDQSFIQKTIYEQVSDELSQFKLEFSKKKYAYIQPLKKIKFTSKKQFEIASNNTCEICGKGMKNPYKTIKLGKNAHVKSFCSIDCFEKEEDWEQRDRKYNFVDEDDDQDVDDEHVPQDEEDRFIDESEDEEGEVDYE